MTKRTIARIGGLAFLFAGFFAVLPASAAAARLGDNQDSEQVNKLLSEAKTLAFQVKEDAQAMETFTRMTVSMESHAFVINQIKEHVNALARQVTKLNEAKAMGAPWQKTAIDRINPFIDELAAYTTAAIEHINGEQKHTLAEYKDYLEANADYASDLAAMIGDFVDYGRTRQRVERLGAKLEVPDKR